MVREVARAGRGTSTLVEDGCSDLNGLVIQALSQAVEPSITEVQALWNGTLDET